MHPDWQSEIIHYCEENSSPVPAFLDDLVRFSWLHTTNPRQLSGHLQGRFLAFISKLLSPDCILEVGTFTGYAAHCLAEGLSSKGELHTIEADDETAWKAMEQAKTSPFGQKIRFHMGDAAQIIPQLGIKPDIVFVDADKQGYPEYLSLCLPILSPKGVILFDNTLWSGKVLDGSLCQTDADTRNMHAFNRRLAEDKGLDVLLLPIRDGLTMVRRRN